MKPLGYFTSSPAIETFLHKHTLSPIDKAFLLVALSEFVFQKARGSEDEFGDAIPDLYFTLPPSANLAADLTKRDILAFWDNTFGELSGMTSEQALGFIAFLSQS